MPLLAFLFLLACLAQIAHHKSVRTCKTKDGINLKLVPHATCKDISKGIEREGYTEVKASMLVPATNEVGDWWGPGNVMST